MAGVYNRGKKIFSDASLAWLTSNIEALLVGTSYVFNPDHNVVSDIVTHEVSGSGYVRQVLTGKEARQNNTADRAELDADPTEFPALDVGTAAGVVLYKKVTDDTDSELICFVDTGGFPVATAGTPLSITWAATGILHQL